MPQESHHHQTAHERFYLSRRLEFLERANAVAEANDPIAWQRVHEEYEDVCDGQVFLELLKTRCGYAPANVPKNGGSST